MRSFSGWIEVWPTDGRKVNLVGDGSRLSLGKELSDYVEDLWAPKAGKGWKSSLMPFVHEIRYDFDGQVRIKTGTMQYHQSVGIADAIEKKKPFAPKQGFSPSLSVGFPTVTKDGKVIFQRRAPDVHCPNVLIHEPCGYMASMNFAPRAECDDQKYAKDPRLFDLKLHLDAKAKELASTFGLDQSQVSYNPQQDFIATGWLTKEMYFSTTGRVDATQEQLKIPERGEFFFVPVEHLKDLINNQGKLSGINAIGYRPSDPREIPLLDESLAGLIWGYGALTGEKLDIYETIRRLDRNGIEIRVNSAAPDELKLLTALDGPLGIRNYSFSANL